MRILLTLLCLGLSLSCDRSFISRYRSHEKIPVIASPAKIQSFPTAPRHLQAKEKISSFEQAFALDRCVQLELTDASPIASIKDLLFHDQRIYVQDRIQNEVFVFTRDGKFLQTLAKRGDGPGEYRKAVAIQAWGEDIAVLSQSPSKLIIYTGDGQLKKEVNFARINLFVKDRALWDGKRALMASYPAMTADTPAHAFVDIQNPKAPKILYGFGKNPPHYYLPNGTRNPKMPGRETGSFIKINNLYWHSTPYSSDIQVYDPDGHKIANIPSGFPPLTFDMLEGITDREEINALNREYYRAHRLTPAGPYVLASYVRDRNRANLFDIYGNLLSKDLKTRPINPNLTFPTDTGQLAAIMPFHEYGQNQNVIDLLGDHYQKLLDAGYDPEKREDYNPWIFLYEPKLKDGKPSSPTPS